MEHGPDELDDELLDEDELSDDEDELLLDEDEEEDDDEEELELSGQHVAPTQVQCPSEST